MGQLVLVPTPIGNLSDISERCIQTLRDSDLVLCEDTRHSKKLLQHLGINVKLQSYHMHNEHSVLEKTIATIKASSLVSLVSDAGTPGISDPGFLLVRTCIEEGIEVQAIPGPSAFVSALVISGLPCERFTFEGFLPHKKGRQTRLISLEEESRTMVFYESPHRLLKTLIQFKEHFGETRRLSISREISKLHEETYRGDVQEAIQHFESKKPKGEFVIVLEGKL